MTRMQTLVQLSFPLVFKIVIFYKVMEYNQKENVILIIVEVILK